MGPTRARHESKKLLMCCDAFIHLCLFSQSLYDSKKSVGWDVVQTRNAWALNGARQAKNVFKRNLSIKGADLKSLQGMFTQLLICFRRPRIKLYLSEIDNRHVLFLPYF